MRLAGRVAIACMLLAAGCSSNHNAKEPGTVNFLIESMPANLDPRIGSDAQSQHLDSLIFDSLLAHDAQMNIVPDLAERWEARDPLTYVFHLRQGVKFHDGRTLTSADVKFTFDSILDGTVKTPKRGAFRTVTSIEAPDDSTIVFHLREPYASFLWNLTRPGVGIVPRGAGPEVSQRPVGTGPFRFVSAITDQEIVLERNSGYFGDRGVPAAERGNVERVRFRIVPDAIVRALELRKGSADVAINSLSPDMVVTLAKEQGIIADEQPGTTIAYIGFNLDDPILAHREVRQALAYATDRATLIKYLLRGQARAASSLLPPNHWAYAPDVPQYDFDPARAERLLDAAGYPRGADGVRFHLEFKTSTEESSRLISEAIADQWKRVGVKIELRPLEFATFYADLTRGSFQLSTQRWVGGNNDPDIFETVFSSKKIPPNGSNRGHYRNPKLDALLDQARVEMDREKRKALLWEIQKIVAEDEPYINLWYPDNVCVHRERLTGIVIPPAGDYDFVEGAKLQ
ncbi:MAG: ABC transporter substrate-binding protein [Candidatus Acidiferrales bacterium]